VQGEWRGEVKETTSMLKCQMVKLITIPSSKELKTGLLRAALKKAGLTEEEFLRLLK